MDGKNGDEENNNEENTSSWWGFSSLPSWIQSAKEKSSNAYEFMKRDLTEFSQVVQTDAVAAVSSTANIIKEKLTIDNAEAVAGRVGQSLTSVLGTITDVFAPPQREIEDGQLMIIKDSEPVCMDWWQSQLYLIRKDRKTFCHEPEGPPEMYEKWLESFDPEEHQEEMTEIMMTCTEIRALYDKLVPSSVSHLEFWHRYFYRVHLLRKAEAKRADLMKKAEQISIDDIEWDKVCKSDERLHQDSNIRSKEQNSTAAPSSPSPEPSQQDTICSTELILGTSQSEEPITKDIPPTNNLPSVKTIDDVSSKANSEIAEIQSDPSSVDSTDGSRMSPIESLGKGSSTGDDWEKDFDLEINENDLKKESSQPDSKKEEDDDWEKWQ